MSARVEVEGVTRQFGPAQVLRGISLTSQPGEVVAIYGRSGSGKTTLLNIVGGLDRPDSGTVRVDGLELPLLSETELDQLRRTRLAFVFQSYGLLPHLNALENVLFGLRLAGCSERLWDERARDALECLGLEGRMRHRPAELSGGERQRVAIARAMAVRPRLLLADEPTGALDRATGEAVIASLVRFARETEASIWVVTHDEAVRRQVDRAYRIIDGQLTAARNEVSV